MAIFFMFGKYSPESVKGMSSERTERASSIIKKFGGKIISMYALFGDQDLILITDLPGNKEAMQASVALSKLTGISFSTSPAVTVDEFDKMMGDA